MIPRRRINIYKGALADIFMAILKGDMLKGGDISEFESAFAETAGVEYAIAVPSGRRGLCAILKSLKLNKGDEVMLPALTYHALPRIIADMGYSPVFADIEKKSFGFYIAEIEKKINKRTRVIVATHLFGTACDIEGIVDTAKRHEIRVVEDCAQSLGSRGVSGGRVGTFGDAAFFSFDITKTLNTFGGGMVVTRSKEIAEGVRRDIDGLRPSFKDVAAKIINNYLELLLLNTPLNAVPLGLLHNRRLYGFIKSLYRGVHGSLAGSGAAFSNIQAIIGLKQLKNIDKAVGIRRRLGERYLEELRGAEGIGRENIEYLRKDCIIGGMNRSTFYNFIVLVEDSRRVSDRLAAAGIDTGSREEILENCGNLYDGTNDYREAEYVVRRSLELPMYRGLKDGDISRIVSALKEILSEVREP
ncbi:MAG: aminotransferase class I/II-fold pyridoxal phosphate-dependent enzyme [Elusimicrobia bacterium]|nr:aminotransferase class I/II-fold pyridoxal phosphate-dependent enzyme [Elusimicrobiota bacterium]